MIAGPTQFHAAQYAVQYEVLRLEVLGARGNAARTSAAGQPRAVGLALLLCQGMPGWVRAIETVIRSSTLPTTDTTAFLPSEPCGSYESVSGWLSGVPRHDLTTLLASLVLSTRRLENSAAREVYRSCP